MLRVGHKGADAIRPGNTIESFEAAVEAGVDMIELDVLRPRSDFINPDGWRTAPAGHVERPGGPLVVAHDWGAARRRRTPTLEQVLDAFTRPPLDEVQIDLDLKIAGREDEVVAALRQRGLLGRAGVSTMEIGSLTEIQRLEPALPSGWTLPKTTRDWNSMWWAKPLVIAGLYSLRRSLPGEVRGNAGELGVTSVWAYQAVITAGLVRACDEVGCKLIAWTVDDLERMRELAELGVDGICSNDPRLFSEL
ncbi:MAG: glycerophosphodiester phosphodiesterase [Solirubrobacterales bacterium]